MVLKRISAYQCHQGHASEEPKSFFLMDSTETMSKFEPVLIQNEKLYIYMCVCVCVCVYIYIYIYIYTHTHVYTDTK